MCVGSCYFLHAWVYVYACVRVKVQNSAIQYILALLR